MNGLAVRSNFLQKMPSKQLFWVSRFRINWLWRGLEFSKSRHFSHVPWKLWGISFHMRYWEARWGQYCRIGGHLKKFQSCREKMLKTDVFHKTLISRNLLKEANIQAMSMWNLTSWRFQKCGTYWRVRFWTGVRGRQRWMSRWVSIEFFLQFSLDFDSQ